MNASPSLLYSPDLFLTYASHSKSNRSTRTKIMTISSQTVKATAGQSKGGARRCIGRIALLQLSTLGGKTKGLSSGASKEMDKPSYGSVSAS
jgi:hypothetical protein